MDPQEVTDTLRSVINNMIKDTPESKEQANADLHAVLAAKMRDRVNPPVEEPPVAEDPVEEPTEEEPGEE